MVSEKTRKRGIFKKIKNFVNRKSKKVFKSATCSANKKGANKYSCYNKEALIHIQKQWNKRHPDKKILSNNPREIWNEMKINLNNTCETEACWLRQTFMKSGLNRELLNYTFAPVAPKSWITKPNTWLSSVDLSKVMKQYEKKYNNFRFIGPSPIDYDVKDSYGERVWDELYNFNVSQQLKKGKKKIGIIFNTDDHTKGGAHWISLFLNLDNGKMLFFDSVGDKAPSNVIKFCNGVKDQANKLKGNLPEYTFEETHPHEHQQNDTECGIYSLYFIAKMLASENYDFFKKKVIDDKAMEKFRNYFFNKPGTF